jgi:CRISPR-associated endonuclease Cas1
MAASHTLPHSPALRPISKHGVLVLHGFGIKIRLDRGHFLAEWGVGLNRYQVRLSRVDGHKLHRVILLSSDGYISLEALRFITDVGASFSMIDKRGKALMVCTPTSPSDSKLRRAQSLALINGTALRISKELISQKLDGQAALVRDMLHNDVTADAILRFRDELSNAQSNESVRLSEARAARWYWQAWVDVPIRWARKDEKRVPQHWKYFGSRISQLTHSPRLATNPANACMNLLHQLCENECRIALVACGLDPDIGCLHADTPGRSSLANDLQEIVRPSVDAFILNWLQAEVWNKADFWEDRSGNCRLSTALATKFCQTSDTWRRMINPHAEWLTLKLYESTIPTRSHFSRSVVRLATRLTQRHRKSSKGSEVPTVPIPKPEHVCSGCGKKIPRDETRCLKCSTPVTRRNFAIGRRAAQMPDSIAKRSSTMQAHKTAINNWNPADLPAWFTRQFYISRIVPALAKVPKAQIRRVLKVSESYAAAIQKGHIPHARHWMQLAHLAGISGIT